MTPCVVGYSYLPLFFNVESGMPSTSSNDKKISPVTGNYQMPLFHVKPEEKKPFTYEKFVFLERIPTASVLIRVVRAQTDPNTGLPIRASELS